MFEHLQRDAAAPRARLRGWLPSVVAAVVVVPLVGCTSGPGSQRFSDGLSIQDAPYVDEFALARRAQRCRSAGPVH